MKRGTKILSVLLGIIFLMSATGIVVYQSHCSCTGDEYVSVFVSPETCDDSYHSCHIHAEDGEAVPATATECHECASHTSNCGCNNLIVSYYKLKNEVVHEKVRIAAKQSVKTIMPEFMVVLFSVLPDDTPELHHPYTEPAKHHTSLDFLIHIHQLKIPHSA